MRRVFWLSVGAAAGITGYRRATAMGRAVSLRVAGDRSRELPVPLGPAQPNGTGQGPAPRPAAARPRAASRSTVRAAWRTSRAAWRTQKAAIAQVRAAGRFARDVREGMDMYMSRLQGRPGSTLATTARTAGAPGPTATNGRPRGRNDHVKDGR